MVSPLAVRRVLLESDPYAGREGGWPQRSRWPARWVHVPDAPAAPFVAAYRLALALDEATTLRLHVSADERYELLVDGERIGRGPDRGDPDHWTFVSYDVDLPAGEHRIAARVWTLGEGAPIAQLTLKHGFLLAAEGRAELDTGTAAWEAAVLPGLGFLPFGVAWGCGLKTDLDGTVYPWGWAEGADELAWSPATVGDRASSRWYANDIPPAHLLVPAILPEQWSEPFDGGRVRLVADYPGEARTHDLPVRAADSIAAEAEQWQALLGGRPLTVPANARRRVLIDLEEYVCGYPELRLAGGLGSVLRVRWLEALLDADGRKGNRDEVEGRFFRTHAHAETGVGDRFTAGGGDHTYTSLWWEAGRFVEVTVDTADEPLTVNGLRIVEDRYPYEDASAFASSDPQLADIQQLGVRTLQMCSHETTMDCPFYEQLQYAGDTRLQLLVTYMISDDDRLARQALLAFGRSRDTRGLTRSRYPSWVRQTIPPFSLWWAAMVHDFAAWRGDLGFVATLMPGVRAVLDAHRAALDENDLLHSLDGWNFSDWVDGWKSGSPPEGDWGVSGVLNFQLAHVAALAAKLEGWLGEDELAARHQRLADRVRAAAEREFWSADRGMYADDPAHEHWSEHTNSLALLSGATHGPAALLQALDTENASRATVYFSHYLFEALGQIGRVDVLRERLELWTGLREQGLRTVVEQPEPTRSDCHAWGAHPIFHLFGTVLGVRPAAPGMAAVTINPQLGGLSWAEGTLRTPHGPLRVRADESGVTADLPAGIVRVDEPSTVSATAGKS
ncbi:MAG TPA: hypothetical protein VHX59_04225 [Mycobacteriales bacterium]|nr:hypothetical protein [Mycobacteriales bacterium]